MTPFTKRIHEAFDYASIHHHGQERKDPDERIPYVSHLFGVTFILAQYDYDEDVLIAGVLHDLIEDVIQKQEKPAIRDQMRLKFGEGVYQLVDWVTQVKKDKQGNKFSWQERNNAYIERIMIAPFEAKAISCADKIHNIQSLVLGCERGQPMWQSLKSSPAEQIQKFRDLHKALSSDWSHPLLERLKNGIDQLELYLPEVQNSQVP